MTDSPSIPRILDSDHGRAVLATLPPPETFSGRTALAREVCRAFGFSDAAGAWRLSSCLAALRDMEAAGRLRLPPPGPGSGVSRRPCVLARPVPAAVSVPPRVDGVRGLRLQLVETPEEARILATLLSCEHPQGAAQHAGRQVRYLIGSDHGWLGGFVFASPSSALGPRDRWIGWSDAERAAGLGRVVGMSRFLIREDVRCRNLASKALGLCLRRVGADFAGRYGLAPVLAESFAGPEYDGTSLRAAGWTYVGESSGRGRRAEAGRRVPPKSIWMRPLAAGWREELGVAGRGSPPPAPPSRVLGPGEGLDMASWAENEFGGGPFGRALTKRLVKSVRIQSSAPSKTFFTAAHGDGAAVSGYYRMMERPDDSAFTPEAILSAHRERTRRRLRGAKTALLIEDGSDLNFATRRGCKGPGVISRNKSSSGTLGIHMHSTFAVNGEGIPLGVPRIEFDCPDGVADAGKPPDERKSARWLRGWRDSSRLAASLPGARVVSVMDREGDVAALFAERQAGGGADLLVRAKHDRVLPEGGKLFERLRGSPALADHEVRVDRASARREARGQKGFAGREARLAQAQLRWREIEIPVPRKERLHLGSTPIRLNAVHVFEANPPERSVPVDWLLLTTLPVADRHEAASVLDLYSLRWRIEDWHRILKFGCDVEKIALSTAVRVKRAVAINAVIAWRLAALTLMGSDTPELSALAMFDEAEIAMLLD